MMTFTGAATRLDPEGIQAAAVLLGVKTAHIKTVLDVETNGRGFDQKGRPSMLFEPHIFYRLLGGAGAQNTLRRAIDEGVPLGLAV